MLVVVHIKHSVRTAAAVVIKKKNPKKPNIFSLLNQFGDSVDFIHINIVDSVLSSPSPLDFLHNCCYHLTHHPEVRPLIHHLHYTQPNLYQKHKFELLEVSHLLTEYL